MEQMSKYFPDSFYRVTIKGLCVKNEKVLMMRESEKQSRCMWELPGGGLDFGEDIKTAFSREVDEEMGLKVSAMSDTPVYVWTHKHKNKRDMDWFYAVVIAYKVDFEDLNFLPSDECEEIRFVSVEEMLELNLGDQMRQLPELINFEDFS
ncbi:MAG: 8-oxo-dGTP diphosphatase [Acidimicrobiales bacterium]|jgi:8-oxo-dGTP diphosphatase